LWWFLAARRAVAAVIAPSVRKAKKRGLVGCVNFLKKLQPKDDSSNDDDDELLGAAAGLT